MASATTKAALKRGAIALAASVALLVLLMAAFALYGRHQLARAESIHLEQLRSQVVEPPTSSTESLEYTERLQAAAAKVTEDWPHLKAGFHNESPELLRRIAPQIEVFLGAAEVAPAHEALEFDSGLAFDVLRVARLLERAAVVAAAQGDEARQVRCAEALSAIGGAYYARHTLGGALVGAAVEEMALSIVQRLVEDPATSPEALDRVAALLGSSRPPLRAAFASEALRMIYAELFTEEASWAERLLRPEQEAVACLIRARALERCGRIMREIDGPLVEALDAEPVRSEEDGALDILATTIHGNARDAIIKVKTLETIHALGMEAVAARRAGEAVDVSRPELQTALDRYWRHEGGGELPPGPARTRRLLTWRALG